METDYYIYTSALFGLIFGIFGMLATGSMLLLAIIGLVSIGLPVLIVLTLAFIISSSGAGLTYIWFIESLDE